MIKRQGISSSSAMLCSQFHKARFIAVFWPWHLLHPCGNKSLSASLEFHLSKPELQAPPVKHCVICPEERLAKYKERCTNEVVWDSVSLNLRTALGPRIIFRSQSQNDTTSEFNAQVWQSTFRA